MTNKEHPLLKIFLDSWHPFFWLASAILIVYSATLLANIVYLDDNVLVTGQYQFNKDLSNIPQAFNEDIFQTPNNGGTFYRPVERLSFMMDAQLGQEAIIFMSHFSNILLHILSICLLFYFLIKLKIKKEIAFLFALFFGIHPLGAQTVAFISGRNDSLLAIFIFPSLIFFLDFLETHKKKYFVWHLIFLAIALFTKETAAVLPIICGFYLLIFVGCKKILENFKFYLKIGFSWFGVTGIWLLIRMSVLHNFVGNAKYNVLLSIYNNLPSMLPAIGKIFLPFDLSVFPVMKDMTLVYGIISLVILAIWFFLSEKKNFKMILFGFSWFFIFIFLTLIKPLGTLPEFSENRIYIPMFGFIFVILGLGKIKLPEFIKNKISNENLSKIILFTSLFIILIFSSVTLYRNHYYNNKLAFWLNATNTSPSFAFNHNNLGAMYYLDGNINKAEIEFNKALLLNPKEPMAHSNLGLVYSKQNKLQEAEDAYKKELEVNPNYDNAYYNLGLLYWQENKHTDAETNWKKTLEVNPNYSDAMNALAIFYYTEKDYDKAKMYAYAAYQRGVQLPPELIQLFK